MWREAGLHEELELYSEARQNRRILFTNQINDSILEELLLVGHAAEK